MKVLLLMTVMIMMMMMIIEMCKAYPIYIVQHPVVEMPYAHPGVLANDALEETLPSELRNNFYKDPRIVAGLAKESWFGYKEMQVIDREADKIPRAKIYDVLHNAGLAKR